MERGEKKKKKAFRGRHLQLYEMRCPVCVCVHQESQAAQRQILMEFLKEARRNKREVLLFFFPLPSR